MTEIKKIEKILLTILPYWDPMIPPMGITSLKTFLQKHGYQVKTEDLIVKDECLTFYHNYFSTLKKGIPEEKRGNFNNIGHDVLQCHMMAHQRYTDENDYVALVKELVYKSYYVEIDDTLAQELNRIMSDFYTMLADYFLQLLEREKPDVLGVTAYKCTVPASLFVLKLTREKYPNIKTLMGGGTFNETHAPDSPNFEILLDESKDYLDKIILGQGELLFLKYLRGELPENQRVYTREDIDGRILAFEEQDLPDFSNLDMAKYPCLAATASASCMFDCSFCVTRKVSGHYRSKDPKQVVEEMITMYKKHGHQLFFMTDSLLNPMASDVAQEFIKSGVSLYYDAYFRVDDPSADIRNTLLWRRGGMYRVRLGTESGSPHILEAMEKKITVQQIKASVTALAHAGIKTTTYWVIGHPDESEEDFQQTLDLIEELKDDIFQAECNYFLLHYSKQASEDHWKQNIEYLYTPKVRDMLLFEYYTPGPGMPPSREVTFQRVHRYYADERWQRLHKNAVPALMDFKKGRYIDDTQKIKLVSYVQNQRTGDEDFDF